ncbi:hypothetical protein K7X08_036802 [Anisodus acutangulus]|uniref:Uncharacterized protein n=1 Tax=Anisodus acutangulus TaxID=402998 RepID=A0A9Q1L6N4_9SOLA|nr:hypothetical protein K7X08_036802 [Anisodus acutangulus]
MFSGCDQKHEEDMDSEKIYKDFVLRVMAARSPNVRLQKALSRHAAGAGKNIKCPLIVPLGANFNRLKCYLGWIPNNKNSSCRVDVFAALVSIINSKIPVIGDILLRRIILQLKRPANKPQLLASVKFIAHLVNQQVVHELIALELLTFFLENPTDDSVEVAVSFVTKCVSILQDVCPLGLHATFGRFLWILHEGEIDKRVQFLIENLFAL